MYIFKGGCAVGVEMAPHQVGGVAAHCRVARPVSAKLL